MEDADFGGHASNGIDVSTDRRWLLFSQIDQQTSDLMLLVEGVSP